jgi:hypothetical protein
MRLLRLLLHLLFAHLAALVPTQATIDRLVFNALLVRTTQAAEVDLLQLVSYVQLESTVLAAKRPYLVISQLGIMELQIILHRSRLEAS